LQAKLIAMTLMIILGAIGPWQIVLIAVVILLMFGGRKLPELMKGIGQGIREFKDAKEGKNEELPDKKNP
jgi:sec-independent protein translocase protein TatA